MISFTFDVCYCEERNINEAEEPTLNAGELTEVNHVSVLGGPVIFYLLFKCNAKGCLRHLIIALKSKLCHNLFIPFQIPFSHPWSSNGEVWFVHLSYNETYSDYSKAPKMYTYQYHMTPTLYNLLNSYCSFMDHC